MKRILIAVLVAGAIGATITRAETLDQPCRGLDRTSPRSALDACAKDTGINASAACAGAAMGLVDVPGLPGQRIEDGANYWSRKDMIAFIRKKAREGSGDAAVTAAICCVVEDAPVKACLDRSRPAVAIWLKM